MKHVIFGGDGFVGRHLAARLVKDGEEVVVCDIEKSSLPHYSRCRFMQLDVTDKAQFMQLDIEPDDMVYNLSAKLPNKPTIRARRHAFFWTVNYRGAVNIIEKMADSDANRLVHYSTDMIYGHTVSHPKTEDHPARPLGEYGLSKWKTEELAAKWREKGMKITLFRPRPVIGPGRPFLLARLFNLIDSNLPIPMIGSGRNSCQFISVFDCAEAARLSWKTGVPNDAYNLGSDNPLPVRTLLSELVRHAGSKSMLVPTPGWAVKRVLDLCDVIHLPIMDPEHYLVAGEMCVLDCSRAKQHLGWSANHHDRDMFISAYNEHRAGRAEHVGNVPAASNTAAPT